jgi:hypothetical protein
VYLEIFKIFGALEGHLFKTEYFTNVGIADRRDL